MTADSTEYETSAELWRYGSTPEDDQRQVQALVRILAAARAGAPSPIDDQIDATYLLSKAINALTEVAHAQEYGNRNLMWQATVPAAFLPADIALLLDKWANICEDRWDMYRRVQARPDDELAIHFPSDLLAGRRLATEDEARQLAIKDATELRTMADAHRVCFTNNRGHLRLGRILSPDEPLNVPTSLYFWYDANHVLLYIGITGDLASRQTNHAKRSSWAEFADHSKIHRYPTRQKAEQAEEAAIKELRPLFNRIHNNTAEARQRLVAYLIKHGRTDLLAPNVSRG